MTRISLIAAMSENRTIGCEGGLPWRIPADLRHFKRLTSGHALVMGRRTFESLDGPLPGRASIVMTRRDDYAPHGALVARTLDDALRLAEREEARLHAEPDQREVFIGGGEAVFADALPRAERIYLTIVHARYEGDTHFPVFDEREWRIVEERTHPAGDDSPHELTFRTLDRRR